MSELFDCSLELYKPEEQTSNPPGRQINYISIKDIAKRMELSLSSIRAHLQKLREKGSKKAFYAFTEKRVPYFDELVIPEIQTIIAIGNANKAPARTGHTGFPARNRCDRCETSEKPHFGNDGNIAPEQPLQTKKISAVNTMLVRLFHAMLPLANSQAARDYIAKQFRKHLDEYRELKQLLEAK